MSKTVINTPISKGEFIRRARNVHQGKYDYSNVEFNTLDDEIVFKCNHCGKLIAMKAIKHLAGRGCEECYPKHRLTTPEFISRSVAIHGDAFNYSKVDYKQFHEPVELVCNNCHKTIWQKPDVNLAGFGCWYCNASSGVKKIVDWLDEHKIKYETEKTFDGLVHKHHLRYDFYLPQFNTLIEYNGESHYRYSHLHHKTQEGFQDKLMRDELKKQYAKDNGYDLIVISYKQIKNIPDILSNLLGIQYTLHKEHPKSEDTDIQKLRLDCVSKCLDCVRASLDIIAKDPREDEIQQLKQIYKILEPIVEATEK